MACERGGELRGWLRPCVRAHVLRHQLGQHARGDAGVTAATCCFCVRPRGPAYERGERVRRQRACAIGARALALAGTLACLLRRGHFCLDCRRRHVRPDGEESAQPVGGLARALDRIDERGDTSGPAGGEHLCHLRRGRLEQGPERSAPGRARRQRPLRSGRRRGVLGEVEVHVVLRLLLALLFLLLLLLRSPSCEAEQRSQRSGRHPHPHHRGRERARCAVERRKLGSSEVCLDQHTELCPHGTRAFQVSGGGSERPQRAADACVATGTQGTPQLRVGRGSLRVSLRRERDSQFACLCHQQIRSRESGRGIAATPLKQGNDCPLPTRTAACRSRIFRVHPRAQRSLRTRLLSHQPSKKRTTRGVQSRVQRGQCFRALEGCVGQERVQYALGLQQPGGAVGAAASEQRGRKDAHCLCGADSLASAPRACVGVRAVQLRQAGARHVRHPLLAVTRSVCELLQGTLRQRRWARFRRPVTQREHGCFAHCLRRVEQPFARR
mmetsp:Transcript_42037/g.98676  ORF Transcript_42037/g.98676 Transcript_42037/m.98676 type:complete len:498 (+) Transcript_42037:1012-2505(+)